MIAAWLFTLAMSVPAAQLPPAAGAVVERHLTLMGTPLTVTVEGPSRSAALRASERAVEALEAAEGRLSTWRQDSELARLNRAPLGRPMTLSPDLAADLAAARHCAEITSGAFDPTVGALAAAWGLRSGGRRPTAEEKTRALAATGMAGLSLSAGGIAVRRRPGLILEEGGFGKGAGLAAAVAALRSSGGARRALLDLGGQVAILGNGGKADEPARWELSVADPRDRRRPVLALSLEGGSLATSGTSERGGHLLDPRTGEPAADFGSLTVWAEDPLLADCLSTGLYVLGPEAALVWAAEHPGVEVLVIFRSPAGLVARATPGLASRLTALVADLEVLAARPRKASSPAAQPDREETSNVDAGDQRKAVLPREGERRPSSGQAGDRRSSNPARPHGLA